MLKFLKSLSKGIKTVSKFLFSVIKFTYRFIRKFLIILILLIIIASVAAHFFLDSFVKDKLQLALDEIPNISTTIGDVDVSFFPPSIVINDIKVKNGVANDIWKQVIIERVRVNPNIESLQHQILEIESVVVIEPEILCDISKIDLTSYINQDGGTGLKEGAKDIKKGFFGGLKKIFGGKILEGTLGGAANILKGTVGIGKTLLNPGAWFAKKKKVTKDGKEVEVSNDPIVVIVKTIHIKQGVFIPEQDLLWIKGGEKIALPDITLNDLTNNSRDAVIANVEKVVVAAVTATLIDLQKKQLFK